MPSRPISYAIAIGILVVFGYLGVRVYQRSSRSVPSTTSAVPVVAQNANTTSVATPVVERGDIPVAKSTTYREFLFEVDTAFTGEAFHRKKADQGMTYLVLFLKPLSSVPSTNPLEWAGSELRLKNNNNLNVAPLEVSIPRLPGVSGGYLWFAVPKESKGFSLEFGSKVSGTSIDLGF